MNLDLKKLRHFVAVARMQSFSLAADALNITQSALSRSIQALEAQYATRLFDRSRAGVHLTAKGEELSDLAEALLQSAGTLEQHFVDAGSGIKGNVGFGMAPLPAKILLPQLVPQMVGWQCGRITAAVQRTETLMSLLLNGELEFLVAPVVYAGLSKLIEIEELASVPTGLFVRPGHGLSGIAGVTGDDLRSYPMMTTGLQKESLSRLYFGKPFIVTDNVDSASEIAQKSDVIYLSGNLAVRREVEVGLLMPLQLAEGPIDNVVFGLFTLKHRSLGPLASRAVRQIKRIVKEIGIDPA